jgi:hypothetical protein
MIVFVGKRYFVKYHEKHDIVHEELPMGKGYGGIRKDIRKWHTSANQRSV